jgi:hypothetical protein
MLTGLLEPLVTIILFVTVATQILWPALTGGRWFPAFRRHDLHKERDQVEEELAQENERREIEELRAQLDQMHEEAAHKKAAAGKTDPDEHSAGLGDKKD